MREKNASTRKLGDADLWLKIWEELDLLVSKEFSVEVEHVKAHRTKKDKKKMSMFEKFVTEVNETADDLAKAGAILDEGFMAEARVERMQQEREEVYTTCSMQPAFTAEWKNGRTVKNSSRSQKKSGSSWIIKRGDETSNGVVC